jgi:hypothetical protein
MSDAHQSTIPRLIALRQVRADLNCCEDSLRRYLAKHEIRVVSLSRNKRFLAEPDYLRLIERAGKAVEA